MIHLEIRRVLARLSDLDWSGMTGAVLYGEGGPVMVGCADDWPIAGFLAHFSAEKVSGALVSTDVGDCRIHC
jgi:hypothetical protein